MVVQKRDVGRLVEWRDRKGRMRKGTLVGVGPKKYAAIRYDVTGEGTAVEIVSLQGDGGDDRVRLVEVPS